MKNLLLFFYFIFLSLSSLGQKLYLKHPIYLDVANQCIYIVSLNDSSIITNRSTEESSDIKVFEFSKNGKMKFTFTDRRMSQIIKGEYLSAVKTIKVGTATITKDHRRSYAICATEYYMPVRNGEWAYFNLSGEIIRKEIYKDGIKL